MKNSASPHLLSRRKDVEIAYRLYNAGEFQILRAFCMRAVKDYPNDEDFWRFLGMASLQLGDLGKAKKSLKKSYYLSDHDWTIIHSYLYACLEDHDEESAFSLIEEELGSLKPEEQYVIISSINKIDDILDPKSICRWFCRKKVVPYFKYLGIFKWIFEAMREKGQYF
jgi:tetratricopeptide (TPR) repeat protein